MGRKSIVGYPPDPGGYRSFEYYTYDSSGRLYTYMNRNGKTQTFAYDGLNRMTGFTWNDGGMTPSVSFVYDAASRLTDINNSNATVHRQYFDDNLLQAETENITLSGGTSKTVTYNYDGDGNRSSLIYPGNSYSFTCGFNGRNQLGSITNGNTLVATFGYNLNGDMTSLGRDAPDMTSTYIYDALDRVTHIDHSLNRSGTRTFDYDYDSVGNRKYMKREDNSGDVFGYDLNDQLISGWLDIMNPVITPPGDQTIFYDGAGNRTTFEPYEWVEAYTINDLNQYTQRNFSGKDSAARPTPTPRPRPTPAPRPTPPGQQAATYDFAGNVSIGFDGSSYIHDAQNRLTQATTNGVTMLFDYDGLNRQVSRRIGTNGARTFSVWDGWDLIQEYQSGNSVTAQYLYGPNGVVKNLSTNNFYFQDGSGNTSYVTDSNWLLEYYLYDLQGTPTFYDGNDNPLSASALGVRHLFTGQQWYQELGLYDLRNRFYSPDLGRFLQPDPIGFGTTALHGPGTDDEEAMSTAPQLPGNGIDPHQEKYDNEITAIRALGFGGDETNLYRYCRNNSVKWIDPLGLGILTIRSEYGGTVTLEPVNVTGTDPFGRPPSGPSWEHAGIPDNFFRDPIDHDPHDGGHGGGDRDKDLKNGPRDNKTPKDNTPSPNPPTRPPNNFRQWRQRGKFYSPPLGPDSLRIYFGFKQVYVV